MNSIEAICHWIPLLHHTQATMLSHQQHVAVVSLSVCEHSNSVFALRSIPVSLLANAQEELFEESCENKVQRQHLELLVLLNMSLVIFDGVIIIVQTRPNPRKAITRRALRSAPEFSRVVSCKNCL